MRKLGAEWDLHLFPFFHSSTPMLSYRFLTVARHWSVELYLDCYLDKRGALRGVRQQNLQREDSIE